MSAYIGYDNHIPKNSSVVAESLEDHPPEYAYNWFTYNYWQSDQSADTFINYQINFTEPVEANYWAMVHNLSTERVKYGVQVFNWVNGAWNPIKYFPESKVVAGVPLFTLFLQPVISDKWLVQFYPSVDNEETPQIQVLSIGEVLPLPQGIQAPFEIPHLNYENIYNRDAARGQSMGRVIDNLGYSTDIVQKTVSIPWFQENWNPLLAALESQPFFFSWDYENFPNETVYAWLDENSPIPRYSDPKFGEFKIRCRSLYESGEGI